MAIRSINFNCLLIDRKDMYFQSYEMCRTRKTAIGMIIDFMSVEAHWNTLKLIPAILAKKHWPLKQTSCRIG